MKLSGGFAPWKMVCTGRSGVQQKEMVFLSAAVDVAPCREEGWAPAEVSSIRRVHIQKPQKTVMLYSGPVKVLEALPSVAICSPE